MRRWSLALLVLVLLTLGAGSPPVWGLSLSSGPGSLPTVNCPDTGGNHLNFSGGVWTCGTSAAGGSPGNAFADGVTKGLATFSPAHFIDNGSGLINLSTTQGGLTLTNTNTYEVRTDRFTLQDASDPTRQARFQLTALTPGTTRIYTVPNYDATVATLAGTETFTGKTLSGASNTFSLLPETALTFTDILTGNASTLAHGLLPKLPGNTTEFLRGDGTWAVPSGTGGPGGGAPTSAHYLTDRDEAGLDSEVNLGALSTGLLKLTVSGGVAIPSSAVAGTDYQTPLGYTPEDGANKSPSTSLGTSNTLYPTQGAVKTYVDTALASLPGSGSGLSPVNPQSATYQVLASDFAQSKTIVVEANTFTITLVDTATQPPDGQFITIVNYGDGVVTIAPSGQELNGESGVVTLPASSAQNPAAMRIVSDGSNYVASLAGGLVPFSKFTPLATNTFLGRQSAGTGATEPIPVADAKVMLGLDNVDNTSDAFKNAAPAVLTNKIVLPRLTTPTVAGDNSITPDLDQGDTFILDAISADLTINCPIGTGGKPLPEQWVQFRFKSATPRTLTWTSSCYTNENGIDLPPATTGNGTTVDRIKVVYNPTTMKYGAVASTVALTRGTTTLGSSATFTCNIQLASKCKMTSTESAGTLTIANPGGTPQDGWKLQINLRCTFLQTLAWDTKFIGSAGIPLPTTGACTAGTTRWIMFGVEYSSDLDKYQLIATTQ